MEKKQDNINSTNNATRTSSKRLRIKPDMLALNGPLHAFEMFTGKGFWLFQKQDQTIWLSGIAATILNVDGSGVHTYQDIQNNFNSEDKKRFEQYIIETDENEEISIGIFTLKEIDNTKTNEIVKIRFVPAEYNNFGSIAGVIENISHEISEKEAVVKEKERAVESNKLKTAFMSDISHAIRTPMNAIMGFSELIKIGNTNITQLKEYADIIKLKGNQLLTLVDDISEIAKFETGQLSINNTSVDLNKLLQEIKRETEVLKHKLHKESINIKLDVPYDLDNQSIHSDPGRLQQIFVHLIENALKYTERGFIEIGYILKDNKIIQFYVKDTGIGIHKTRQKNIFNPFKPVTEPTMKKYASSGLGLTLSKGIVEMMGGKIWLESEEGEGSTFYFTIPFKVAEEIDEPVKDPEILSASSWKNKVILIVEDEEVNYKFLEAVLDKTEAKIIHAETGAQAVELCKTLPKIDLVLMDIKMPKMNGIDATHIIKNMSKNIPIIAQTAYSGAEDIEHCKKGGCDDYISKPIDVKLLFEKINKFFYQ